MSGTDYLPLLGQSTSPDDLIVPKARELVRLLEADPPLPFVALAECRRKTAADGTLLWEGIVCDVEAELPQDRLYDLRTVERVAAVFYATDATYPDVIALRPDFPFAPHQNVREERIPRSLCLYEEPYPEVRLSWTPIDFVERIRLWLTGTATGTLHHADQPLEQLIGGHFAHLVLPADIFSPEAASTMEVLDVGTVDASEQFLIASRQTDEAAHQNGPFVALLVVAPPQQHGIIECLPPDLASLHEFLAKTGLDLRAIVRDHIRTWLPNKEVLSKRLILVVSLPKTRELGGAVEVLETWAFLMLDTVQEVGARLGMLAAQGGVYVPLITGPELDGGDCQLLMLKPALGFDRAAAARMNGSDARCGKRIVAIGMGALGSQVFMNLVRSAWGEWTVVDKDRLMPHNLSRHALPGGTVGLPKAEAMALLANSTVEGEPVARPITADVLLPGEQSAELEAAFGHADLILDMSASVPVERHLARGVSASARRASLFLNPSGSDLVMLFEDAERHISLDFLEMQYYRHLAATEALSSHMAKAAGQVRYARSCGDLSTVLPSHLISFFAAVASAAIQEGANRDQATISVWHTDGNPANGMTRHDVIAVDPVVFRAGEWEIVTDASVVAKIAEQRAKRLPNETGGVLIGSIDTERKVIYIVDTILSPSDSVEWPTLYVRGFVGLGTEIERFGRLSGNWLGYIGEWHSHPNGYGTAPSPDDRSAFEWLTRQMVAEGRPALMLIAGEREMGIYVDRLPADLLQP